MGEGEGKKAFWHRRWPAPGKREREKKAGCFAWHDISHLAPASFSPGNWRKREREREKNMNFSLFFFFPLLLRTPIPHCFPYTFLLSCFFSLLLLFASSLCFFSCFPIFFPSLNGLRTNARKQFRSLFCITSYYAPLLYPLFLSCARAHTHTHTSFTYIF